MIKLHNTLVKKIVEFTPINEGEVTIYTCGPTVYDHAHIGNLSSYIYAETLRRTLMANGLKVQQVMNYTDVDDKTIKRSHEKYPDLDPKEALTKLTSEYISTFNDDVQKVGIDTKSIQFIKATESIDQMKKIIQQLLDKKVAYLADDGIYLSIEAYKKSGKAYGQLLNISDSNTSEARIDNDEYDKESVHDFALWKKQKDGEPSWEFSVGDRDMTGRPGWHIECSAMSEMSLGLPFDIHTGGIDLIFPHHENEIAQSTGAKDNPVMANYFVHSNHLLVDGKKMAKSANNFYTLQDIINKGFDPLAFRLLVLQSHYRNESNFTWDNLYSAQNRLKRWKNIAELRWQENVAITSGADSPDFDEGFAECMNDDMDTPSAIERLEKYLGDMENLNFCKPCVENIYSLVDSYFGLNILANTPDINDSQKQTILEREKARETKDWAKSDELRDKLLGQGIGLRDTDKGSIWYRI